MTQEELKRAMARVIEAEIDALVEWGSQAEGVTLTTSRIGCWRRGNGLGNT